MSIKKSLKPGHALADAVQPGKQALRRVDRDRVAESPAIRVVDSLDLDTATRAAHGGAHRWDYLIGTTHADRPLVAVEIHPANTGEAKVVVAKKRAAMEVLRSSLTHGAVIKRWYWVASGTTGITRGTPEARLLDANGIYLVGTRLLLDRAP